MWLILSVHPATRVPLPAIPTSIPLTVGFSVLCLLREAHLRRQAAVFDSKVAFYSSPQATPKEVRFVVGRAHFFHSGMHRCFSSPSRSGVHTVSRRFPSGSFCRPQVSLMPFFFCGVRARQNADILSRSGRLNVATAVAQ